MGNVESEQDTVYITMRMSKETNEILSKAAIRAGRTKRKEAALRMHDHIQQYPDFSSVKTSDYGKSEPAKDSVSITMQLAKATNEALNRSAKLSGRTKGQEASLRLYSHLQQYQDIAMAGKRFTE
ncbi:TraY domain-containing protein [Serratia fonticola]|jgi:predicted DNA-binding protein